MDLRIVESFVITKKDGSHRLLVQSEAKDTDCHRLAQRVHRAVVSTNPPRYQRGCGPRARCAL